MFPFEQFSIEMLVVFAIGLMVLGPKDLPVVMRKIGQFVAKMRGMAAEFRASFDELARQSELDDLRKEVEALRSGAYASSAPAPEPVHDYTPLGEAGSHLDNPGFSFPPQPSTERPPISIEPSPPGEADAAPKRPAAKPRVKKAQTGPIADEPAAGEPAQPIRKPRTKKAAPAKAPAAQNAAE